MKKVFPIIIVVVLLALFAGTLYFLYGKSQEVPIRFATEKPFKTTIIKKTVATGKVIPRKEVEIKPQVSGIIDKLYVEPGQKVKTGDLIARVKIIPNMVSLNNAENRVQVADLNLKNSKIDYDRNKQLLEDGVIAAAAFQQFELAYNNARQEQKAARDNLEIIRKGAASSTGKSANNTLVRATIAGMVLDVPVEAGNSVIEANTFNEGTTIASIADMEDLIFEGKIDESEVGKIRPGMDLLITIGAIEDEQFNAKLEYIAPKGVEENGAIQFEIKAAMGLRDNFFIRANYSANADIVLDRRDSVMAISESLLQFDGDSAFIEVETGDQQFERKQVKTGLSDGINVEVLDGVIMDQDIKNPNKKIEGEG
ncbi:MAG: efflux RND transporter periplasmic adaptor subunit [Bacteroidota bacterium]